MHAISWTARSWSLLACVWTILGAATVAASDHSGIMEVGLVFPRNNTYAPTPVLPIIFGFRNSQLAPSLAPEIGFSIWNYNDKSDSVKTTDGQAAIKVSEAEASSISASVTARACEAQDPPIECPSGNDGDENDAGHGLVVGGMQEGFSQANTGLRSLIKQMHKADAEILKIMSDKRRTGGVVTSCLEASSNSNVLAYMSASTKKTRAALYMAWGMGGTTEWATDLRKYHVPAPAEDWAQFKQLAASGLDPKSDSTPTDQLHCDVDEFWLGLGADAAWEGVVKIWEDTGSGYSNTSFLSSVHATLKIETRATDRGSVLGVDCNTDGCSKGMDGDYSGPAAQLIWNSVIIIWDIHASMALIGRSTTIAKDLLSSQGEPDWKPEDQDKFSNYMGQVIDGWANVTSLALKSVFDGTPRLGQPIADGKLYPKNVSPDPRSNELLYNIRKSIFGCAIPAIWHASSAWALVINSGHGCDASNPLDDYL
ncbi:glycosylhydrolase family 18-6 [Colletotrichum salicis]|uniref:Glycosylhydrolase family 18-6 n=1 Tax=Colletotrichum salicis TaxID=1209931 RepID=A0A135UX24_9PEZI|nr:glycosylhydrolase family 18-6 [Colletotrichum salicis]